MSPYAQLTWTVKQTLWLVQIYKVGIHFLSVFGFCCASFNQGHLKTISEFYVSCGTFMETVIFFHMDHRSYILVLFFQGVLRINQRNYEDAYISSPVILGSLFYYLNLTFSEWYQMDRSTAAMLRGSKFKSWLTNFLSKINVEQIYLCSYFYRFVCPWSFYLWTVFSLLLWFQQIRWIWTLHLIHFREGFFFLFYCFCEALQNFFYVWPICGFRTFKINLLFSSICLFLLMADWSLVL